MRKLPVSMSAYLDFFFVHAFINAATFSPNHPRINPAGCSSEEFRRPLVLDC